MFFSNVKGHCHGCFFDNIWQHWKAKNVKWTVANGRTCRSHLQEERQQIAVLVSPQSPFEHSRCFDRDTKGADGAADLLEALRNSPLEKLDFDRCSQIPSNAWQKLRGASWTNLREADFEWCLVLQTWLRCLASSLDAVFFSNVKGHCHGCFFDNIWQHWKAKNVKWTVANGRTCRSHLQEERQQIAVLVSPQSPFEHSRCFDRDTKGADGAADLLEVLRNSPLEKLDFDRCSQIPSNAWQKLRGASWTNLREADFEWCLVLQTWLRCLASSLDAVFFSNVKGHCHGCFFDNIWQHWKAKNVKWTVANGRTCRSHLQEERQQIAVLVSPQSPFEHSRCFDRDTKGADGAADLLEALRNSPLEKLDFDRCSQIPSNAWQKLRGASWTNLREADFEWCLVLQTWLRCLASSLDAVFFFRMLRHPAGNFLFKMGVVLYP